MINLYDKLYGSENMNISYPFNLKDNEDTVLCTEPYIGKWLLINSSTADIIKLCNGELTVIDIINHLKDTYVDVSIEEIKQLTIEVLSHLMDQKLIFKSKKEYEDSIVRHNEDGLKSIYIELTSRCNLRCSHCFGSFGNIPIEELDYDKVVNILEQARSLGADSIVFSGGEPLMHKSFIDICKEALQMNFNVSIATNGTIFNDSVLDLFKCWSNLYIQFSLDGIKKETHELLRGKGTFNSTMDTINSMIKNGFSDRITISTTVFKNNVDELEDIIKWCIKNNIENIALKKLMKQGRADNNWNEFCLDGTPEEVSKFFFNVLSSKLSPYKKYIKIDGCSDINSFTLSGLVNMEQPCPLGVSIKIDYLGNVYPCQLLNTEEFSLGNVLQDSLKQIYEGERFNNIKLMSRMRMEKNKKCSICKFVDFCAGGCMAQAFLEYGTIYREYSLCENRYETLNNKLEQYA